MVLRGVQEEGILLCDFNALESHVTNGKLIRHSTTGWREKWKSGWLHDVESPIYTEMFEIRLFLPVLVTAVLK